MDAHHTGGFIDPSAVAAAALVACVTLCSSHSRSGLVVLPFRTDSFYPNHRRSRVWSAVERCFRRRRRRFLVRYWATVQSVAFKLAKAITSCKELDDIAFMHSGLFVLNRRRAELVLKTRDTINNLVRRIYPRSCPAGVQRTSWRSVEQQLRLPHQCVVVLICPFIVSLDLMRKFVYSNLTILSTCGILKAQVYQK